jgi:hypothetical protein
MSASAPSGRTNCWRADLKAAGRRTHDERRSRRFARSDVDERPVLGIDTLMLLAGITALEVRDVIREPEPARRVWKDWSWVFKPTLATEELHNWLYSLK